VLCPFCEAELSPDVMLGSSHGLGLCSACYNPVLVDCSGGGEEVRPLEGVADMRRQIPPGSIGAKLLEHVDDAIENLPVMPEVSHRILALLKDPDFGIEELVALVREDSVLAVSIMRQANSAAFGGLQEIKDLNGACARLGMRNIANTVQLVANRNLFITGNPVLKKSMGQLWRHSVATAHCANEVARLNLAADQETYFLGGLMHDIGKILLLEMVVSPKADVIRDLHANPELMREIITGLHPLFGLLVCQAWKLPPAFRAAAYFHHNPGQCPVKEWMPVCHTVGLANTIAKMEGYGMYEMTEEVFLASHPSSVYLALSDIKLATLRVDLSDKLEVLFETAG
jgi:putative nucleotidyltransferase with HDIG domain